jgi:hypothetical protein
MEPEQTVLACHDKQNKNITTEVNLVFYRLVENCWPILKFDKNICFKEKCEANFILWVHAYSLSYRR